MSEFEYEAIPGLPEKLPDGETLLWQGSPEWKAVARRVLHVDLIIVYFAVLLAYTVGTAAYEGASLSAMLWPAVRLVVACVIAVGVLSLIAKLIERTTIYSITSRRLVMRYGVALPVTLNLPFRTIGSADLKQLGVGQGDIALKIGAGVRLGFLNLWPHVRPWRINHPQPSLRCVPNVDGVAEVLVKAMREAMAGEQDTVRVGSVDGVASGKPLAFPAGERAALGT